MNISLLNERITFQENELIVDEIGNHKNTWHDFYCCFCTVSGEGGSESDEAGNINDHQEMSVTVRWCRKSACIGPLTHRAVFHDEIYDIVGVEHMSYKRRCVKFRCRKEARSG